VNRVVLEGDKAVGVEVMRDGKPMVIRAGKEIVLSAGGFNTPTPGVAVNVVNLKGEPVIDEIGELAVLEPFVGMTRSFWQEDERYLETYWRTVPGIWIHGDLAIRKPTGDFFLRGRSDDTLKLAGKRIGPAEIENVLLELEGVSECAAIGAAGQTHQWCCRRPDKKASLCGCTMMMSSFGKRPTVS